MGGDDGGCSGSGGLGEYGGGDGGGGGTGGCEGGSGGGWGGSGGADGREAPGVPQRPPAGTAPHTVCAATVVANTEALMRTRTSEGCTPSSTDVTVTRASEA